MRRKNRKKYYYILLLISLFGMSFGYATLNSTLIINGTSAIQKNTWDIHFENLKITTGSVTATVEPTITDSNRISDFTFVLDKRGDFYEFTVDIINNGSLDAMIDSIEKTPSLTSEQEKYLTYTITYENNKEIKKNQLVKVNDFVRIKVRVEFKSDITAADLPQTQQVLNLGFHINFIQAEDNAIEVLNNGIKIIPVADGSLDNIGTIVTIGTEKFYIIGTEGDNVKLLSMYNLYVGNSIDENFDVTPLANPTGKQSELAKGSEYDSVNKTYKFPFIGTTEFSNRTSSYTGSLVEGYVNNYKTEIEKFGVPVIEARLITYDELTNSETFACEDFDYCSDKYPWIYSTSYLSGSAYDAENVWFVNSYGSFDCTGFTNDIGAGVRPVIVIKKSDIVVQKIIPVADGSLDNIGTIVTMGSEKFYTIGTEGDNVKLLSAMNITLDENPIQSSSAGTTAFSNTNLIYEESIVKGYVDNYKNNLESNFGLNVVEARLITKDELANSTTFGCSESGYCSTNYPWVYNSTYWTGTSFNTYYVWYVNNDGTLKSYFYGDDYYLGVRPVIVVAKDTIEIKS